MKKLISLAILSFVLCASYAVAKAVTATWADASNNELGFKLYRATVITGPYAVVASVASNVTSATDSTVANGVTYYYYVASWNVAGEGNSVTNAFTVPAIPNPPTSVIITFTP